MTTAALILAALTLWLADGIRRIGAVSTGALIGKRSGTALILIDLQSVFWDHGPYAKAAKSTAETAILAEVAAAKSAGIPVIALRQEWSIPATRVLARLTMKGQAIAGTKGTELAPPFADLPGHVVIKRVQDGFETGALDDLLARLDIGHLRLVGLDLNHCVAKTALAAAQRGYDVEVITDACLAANTSAAAHTQKALTQRGITLRATADGISA